MSTGISIAIGFLAETALHPGTGQSIGSIDQPVAREGGTNLPFIPGSSLKGSLRNATDADKRNFGASIQDGDEQDSQGLTLFGDIRLALLPIRSSVSAYRWATCPLLLERFQRDVSRCKGTAAWEHLLSFAVPEVAPSKALSADPLKARLYLEERTFEIVGAPDGRIAAALAMLIPSGEPYERARARVAKQLLIMSDDDFGWFASFGLPVQARNQLAPETKTSQNLWYEEYLPADTLMYAIAAPRGATSNGAFADLVKKLGERQWLQVGGNESVGRGLCRIHVVQ